MGSTRCSEKERLKNMERRQIKTANLVKFVITLTIVASMVLGLYNLKTWLDVLSYEDAHDIVTTFAGLGWCVVAAVVAIIGISSMEDYD